MKKDVFNNLILKLFPGVSNGCDLQKCSSYRHFSVERMYKVYGLLIMPVEEAAVHIF